MTKQLEKTAIKEIRQQADQIRTKRQTRPTAAASPVDADTRAWLEAMPGHCCDSCDRVD
jgi:hypothetical protein